MFCVDQQHLVPVCSQDALHQVEVPQVQPCLLLIVSRAVLVRLSRAKPPGCSWAKLLVACRFVSVGWKPRSGVTGVYFGSFTLLETAWLLLDNGPLKRRGGGEGREGAHGTCRVMGCPARLRGGWAQLLKLSTLRPVEKQSQSCHIF